MSESEFESLLREALCNFHDTVFSALTCRPDDLSEDPLLDSIRTFQEDLVLTYNKGLVVRMKDGSEFQVTIVQSRMAYDADEEV